jgi:hypothetical protein
MRAWLGNNTSGWHAGSAAVMTILDRWVNPIGVLSLKDNISQLPWKEVDVVIVNGEGTMHDNAPNALAWLKLLNVAKARGKKTALVNTVWQRMDVDVGFIDFVAARDPWSAETLRTNWYLDLSAQIDLPYRTRPQMQLAHMVGKFKGNGKNLIQEKLGLDVHKFGVPKRNFFGGIAKLKQNCDIYFTGEFHGVMMAALAGCGVVKYPSNTWKIESLIDASGIDVPDLRETNDLRERALAAGPGLHDWMLKERERALELHQILSGLGSENGQ